MFRTAVVCVVLVSLVGLPCYGGHVDKFFDLKTDADQLVWLDGRNNALEIGKGNVWDPVRLSRGEKVGGLFGELDGMSGVYFPKSVKEPVIDVFAWKRADVERAVVGRLETRLPFAKMIQLQVGYDVLLSADGNAPDSEFNVGVWTRPSPDQPWQREKKIGREVFDDLTTGAVSGIHKVNEEEFRTHVFGTDLTEWAGKYVRLTFELYFRGEYSGLCRARILKTKIIQSDVRVEFVGEEEPVRGLYAPGLGVNRKTGKKTGQSTPGGIAHLIHASTEFKSATETITIEGIRGYADGGFPTERFRDSKHVGYLVGHHWAGEGYANSATAFTGVIDLHLVSKTCSFGAQQSSLSVNDITESVVRMARDDAIREVLTPSGSCAPNGATGEISEYQLDVRYCGVCGINNSTHTAPNNFLHAFLHCEDVYITSSTDSSQTWLTDGKEGRPYFSFHRIGYARSASGGNYTDAYDFDKVTPHDASDTPNISPSWVEGGWGGAVITAPSSEGEYFAGRYDGEYEKHTGGVGAPQVVKSGDYYYLFFTRQSLPGSFGGGTGVARAPASLLNVDSTQDYEAYDRNDVWLKYTQPSWNGDAIGGFGHMVVPQGSQARVSWNSEVGNYVMFYQKTDEGIFMRISDGGPNWAANWGGDAIGITYGPSHGYYYPTLIGEESDETDKETGDYNQFYFDKTPDGIPGHHTLRQRRLYIDH